MPQESNSNNVVDRQQRVLRKLWHTATGTVVIYLLLPYLILSSQARPDVTNVSARLRWVLWGVALIELVILAWWKRTMLSPDRLLVAAINNPALALVHYMAKSATAIAMANSIAVHGLALALVGRYFWDQYVLTLISFILLLYLYPSSAIGQQITRSTKDKQPH